MNKFTVHYPNGIKRHISKHELALLSDSLQQISSHEYRAASLLDDIKKAKEPAYLEGLFTFELAGEREVERMETPRGMLKRLEQMGFQP